MELTQPNWDWGYIYNGIVYPHFDGPPPENSRKFFTSYRLYHELEIADGSIKYYLVQVHYGHHTGGPTSAYFADPVFEWTSIR